MESLSDMPTVKYREIYRDLKQNILSGKLQTDGALPSQAELTKQYGVATGTVRQSLSALQAEGLIRAVHGKGFFAKKPQRNEHPARIIQAVLMDRMDVLGSLTSDVLHGASQGARELGGSVSILPMTSSESEPLLQSELAIDDQSRLLFWGFVHLDLLEPAIHAGARIAMVGHMLAGDLPPGVSMVCADTKASVVRLLCYLNGLGHRRVMLVLPGGDSAYHRELEADFRAMSAELGMDNCEVCQVGSPWDTWETRAQNHTRLVKDKADDMSCSAWITMGLDAAGHIRSLLENAGRAVPESLSLACICGQPPERIREKGITAIVCREWELGYKAARSLLSDGQPSSERLLVEPMLVLGETCREVNGNTVLLGERASSGVRSETE